MAVKRTFVKSKKSPEKSEAEEVAEKTNPEPVEDKVEEKKEEETPSSESSQSNSESEAPASEVASDVPAQVTTQAASEVGMYEEEVNKEPEPTSDNGNSDNMDMDEPDHTLIGKIKWLLLFIFIIGLFLGASFLSYQFGVTQGKKGVESKVVVEENTPTPTPEEDQDVNLAEYSISVLNGSGIKGEASTLQKSLDASGFKVTTIGNAEEDVVKTLIEVKDSVPKTYIKKLKEELSTTYTLDSDIGELDSSNEEDVVITIGSATSEE